MLFSIYPTDPKEVIDSVVSACRLGRSKMLFTSLHIPESENLKSYVEFLGRLNKDEGLTFCADISPLVFEKLDIKIDELSKLQKFGIEFLRIDFGFTISQIKQIKAQMPIAINASCVTAEMVDEIGCQNLIAWHNYYPRPETGLALKFFINQNKIFQARSIPIYAFVPGEIYFRKPLQVGLPTLESHRGKNAYVNFLHLALNFGDVKIVYAEGGILPNHIKWISEYEQNGIINVPVDAVDEGVCKFFKEREFMTRIEETDFSWRLDNTRSSEYPFTNISSPSRKKASLQIDNQKYPRYQGQLHIIKKDLPKDIAMTHIADISNGYREIADFPLGLRKMKFVFNY
jgi:hypothetical protein